MSLDQITVTSSLVTLVYDALLKSFWRKHALKLFLLNSGISKVIVSSWDDEPKRKFLDRLFEALSNHPKKDIVILKLTKNLIDQKTFPDLRGWDDSDYKIEQAYKAVKDLQIFVNLKIQEINEKESKNKTLDRVKEITEQCRRYEADREILKNELYELLNNIGSQKGGYDFEAWFHKVLDYSDIIHKRPYKTDGRQIDGSLTLEGTTYLLELKFTKNQTGAESIDSFKAKIDKMADNTMGVFVSMAGYSSQAIKDASGKRTTIILLDSSHLFWFLQGGASLDEIISRCRRHISQTAEALLTSDKFYN